MSLVSRQTHLTIVTMSALCGACSFDPTVPSDTMAGPGRNDSSVARIGDAGDHVATDSGLTPDASDGGEAADTGTSSDGGGAVDSGNAPDGGDTLDGGVDAVVVVTNGPHTALLWDSVELDASGSYDTAGETLTLTWTIVSAPAGVVGGFAPFPGTNNTTATGTTTTMYVNEIGQYIVRVEATTSGRSASADVQIDVDGFARVGPTLDTNALAIRPSDGRLFIGSDNGARDYDLGTLNGRVSACTPTGQVEAIAFNPITPVFGHDQNADLRTGTAGNCATLNAPNGPSETRALRRVGTDLWAATDAGYVVFSAGASTRYLFNAFLDINVLERDSSGAMWFGSRDEANSDGVIRMLGAHDENAPRIDLFTGRDDDVEQIRVGITNELWIAARDGVVHVANVNQPTVRSTWTAGNGLPSGATAQIQDIVFDPSTTDVWIATDNGLIRYKRDVDETMFVRVGGGTAIAGGGSLRRLAFDADAARGRSLVLGTSAGTFVSRAP